MSHSQVTAVAAFQHGRHHCAFKELPSHTRSNLCKHVEGDEHRDFMAYFCFCLLPQEIQGYAIDRYLTFENFGQEVYIHQVGMVARAAYAYLNLYKCIPTSRDQQAPVAMYRRDMQWPGYTTCIENELCLDDHRELRSKLEVRDIEPIQAHFTEIQTMSEAISDSEIDCVTDYAQSHDDDTAANLALNHPKTEKLLCLYYAYAFWAIFRHSVGNYHAAQRTQLEEEFFLIFHPGRREAICKMGLAAENPRD